MSFSDGAAVIYCEGAFGTTNGKTAHGLVRRSNRYRILSVIDSTQAGTGRDAGEILGGRAVGIPVVSSLDEALELAGKGEQRPSHLVIGLAPDGGRLPQAARREVLAALAKGLDVDSGLHDFLSDDPEMAAAAVSHGATIRDIRKPPPRSNLHFFSGKISEVESLKVALLGTDSAVGKRTTAWLLKDALEEAGWSAELIGTGQTAWLQGAEFSIVLDSLVNDFVAGEIEHAAWKAWQTRRPDVILLEGQGSLMNPAYPGGFELLAAGRPDVIVLQHAPARREYDGFPGHPLHPIETQIQALELISGKPVVALTLNHEGLTGGDLERAKATLERTTGLVVCDPLLEGCSAVVQVLEGRLKNRGRGSHGQD